MPKNSAACFDLYIFGIAVSLFEIEKGHAMNAESLGSYIFYKLNLLLW